jgi:ABC-type transport system, involved in lipoprotein release, permease component
LIKKIFLTEGALIAFIGAATGLVLGAAICWLQDRVGLVGMGMENAIVANYPVKMKLTDFLSVSAVIVLITLMISFYPARLAAHSFTTKEL